ncbi:hypothetical protein LOTGIDRAFT_206277 [Lottia gigantea]|uniref:60S ribosomal export protein NMD3 n=1 Tax=Lottia gigantea TaxID=225164 RepID=V4AJZ9_LOTGI|nr:hypothetical protein LOTGIDRAFT_206277 [Lottia gigantea]ESO97417.1 hypothetical protein LOTGIDRAFT_206277 [Lottia gigantea]
MQTLDEENLVSTNTILCCLCSAQIEPNPSNMCVACLTTQVDITEGIPKQGVLYFCRGCERYLQPPTTWVVAALESRELLSLCLKKLKGLSKVNLVDAGFIWTEPHSQRIKVKLTVQKEVVNSAILQQVFIVEFTVNSQFCDECHRVEAKDFWRALVQVRQKTDHKKTFFYLEQLILKHKAHNKTNNIKPIHSGLNFYYSNQDDASKMKDFLTSHVPSRYQLSKELISHDIHSNKYQYKFTYSVEIIPVCKDDIVCLPKKLATSKGNISQICICYSVTQMIRLIDPFTLKVAEISSNNYWRDPFVSLTTQKSLSEFMVMEIEIVPEKDKPNVEPISKKHVLADVWVARMCDLGVNDQQYHTRTHLGHLLSEGDTVLGFDFNNANLNNAQFEKLKQDRIPDVIIVKKVYDRAMRNKKRKWKLKRMADGMDTGADEKEYTAFLEDLEEDTEYRQNVNIYVDRNKMAVEVSDTDDEGVPQISLQEMLDDLHISHDATGEDGAAMME